MAGRFTGAVIGGKIEQDTRFAVAEALESSSRLHGGIAGIQI